MSICGETSLIKVEPTYGCAATRLCNTWDTPCCHERKLADLRELARSGKPNYFLTLTTIHRPGRSPDKAADKLLKSWSTLLLKAKRHLKCDIQHLRTTEAHKTGWPHLHALIRAPQFLDEEHIRTIWHRLTGAFEVKLEPIEGPAAVARYLADYLGKGPDKFGRHKRFHTSRNWRVTPLDVRPKLAQLEGRWGPDPNPTSYWEARWRPLPGFYVNRTHTFCYHGLDTS